MVFASQILAYDQFQERNALDQELERDYQKLNALVNGQSAMQIQQLLSNVVQDASRHSEVMNGILYGMLTDAQLEDQYMQVIQLCVKDNYEHLVKQLNSFTGQLYWKLLQNSRGLLHILVRFLVEKKAYNVNSLLLNLLKNVNGTSLRSNANELIAFILSILRDHPSMVQSNPAIAAQAVYTFLRQISYLQDDLVQRNLLVEYCVGQLRQNFSSCKMAGRDLVRALWELSTIPSIQEVYQQIVEGTFKAQGYLGIEDLLNTPCSVNILSGCVPYQLESHIRFIMEKVIVGIHDDVYFEWLNDKYFSQMPNDGLIIDLIRYIVCCFHPSNALLQSPVIPRFAVIGKLLQYTKSKLVSRHVKMALNLDWVCFNPQADSIMNIEPPVLYMMRSVEKYSHISAWMVEFLDQMSQAWIIGNQKPFNRTLRQRIKSGMHLCLQKGVISDIDPLLECPEINVLVKQQAREMFTE
ncbi:hypothetical protein MP228_001110 [Amoeboaphelidium protococcarum]|nr:hypothetical protein MP228_001110 [Amoeboaphelidium protococcarum]